LRSSRAFWCFVYSGLCVLVVGGLSLWTHSPFLFPALGATTFIYYFAPQNEHASPRNSVSAHCVGAIIGWCCFHLLQLDTVSASLLTDGSWLHLAAPALALALTSAAMVGFDIAHPPAGATTLIFSLGHLPHAWQILVVTAGIWLAAMLALVIHRSSGREFPVWRARSQKPALRLEPERTEAA
jgi:CBS-domain-containing membrane protein